VVQSPLGPETEKPGLPLLVTVKLAENKLSSSLTMTFF